MQGSITSINLTKSNYFIEIVIVRRLPAVLLTRMKLLNYPFTNRLRFQLERLLLGGVIFQLIFIGLLLALVSFAAALALILFDGSDTNLLDAMWWAFLRLTDPGYLGDDQGLGRRTLGTVVTVTGYVLFMGSLVAILTQWLHRLMAKLDDGLTPISMDDHVVILGWTDRTVTIVKELFSAGLRLERFLKLRKESNLQVVILAESFDPSMHQQMREELGPLYHRRQITIRVGTPLRDEDLMRVDFTNAAVLVLPGQSTTGRKFESIDSQVVKASMSIAKIAKDQDSPLPQLVTEVHDKRRRHLVETAYGASAYTVAGDAVVCQILAHATGHCGLSKVYSELLQQGVGNAIFISELPNQFESTFWRTMVDQRRSVIPIGMIKPNGQLVLSPSSEEVIDSEHQIVHIARSPESFHEVDLGSQTIPLTMDQDSWCPSQHRPQTVLILGWNKRLPTLLEDICDRFGDGGQVDIVSLIAIEERQRLTRIEPPDLKEATTPTSVMINHYEGNYTLPEDLGQFTLDRYDQILMVASDWLESGEEIDARSLLGILTLNEALREVVDKPHIVAEIFDPDNEKLFEQYCDEVLVSPRIVSHLMANVALRAELGEVFDQLILGDGPAITFESPSCFGLSEPHYSFADIAKAVALRGAIALGVYRRNKPPDLNPSKNHIYKTKQLKVIVMSNIA